MEMSQSSVTLGQGRLPGVSSEVAPLSQGQDSGESHGYELLAKALTAAVGWLPQPVKGIWAGLHCIPHRCSLFSDDF